MNSLLGEEGKISPFVDPKQLIRAEGAKNLSFPLPYRAKWGGQNENSIFTSLNRVSLKVFLIFHLTLSQDGMEYSFWSGNLLPELFPWHPKCVRLWLDQSVDIWGKFGIYMPVGSLSCMWLGCLEAFSTHPSHQWQQKAIGNLRDEACSLLSADHANQILLRKPWISFYIAGSIHTGSSVPSDCEGTTCRFCSLSVAFAFFPILWSH